jgi:arylsulfatase A-like enzyme
MGDFLDRFIEENKDKPLFIYIHTMEPHIPYEVPLPWRAHSRDIPPDIQRDLYEKFAKSPPYPSLADPTEAQVVHMKNIYRDSVLAASRHFKKMKAALEKRGVLDDSSLLILSSDHGERFFEHKSWIHGPPDIYNEVLRIPLMMKGRGIRAGVYGHPVQLIDIFPTAMEWLGDSPNKLLPGVSLFEAWKSGGILSADRPIYSDGTGDRPQYAVIKNGIKVIIDARGEEVYNLNRDPFEKDNRQGLSRYSDMILETKDFQGRFKTILDRISRGLSAEERDRLRTLGYIH